MNCPVCKSDILASTGANKANGDIVYSIKCNNGHETDLDVKSDPEAKKKYDEDMAKLKSLGVIS